MRDVNIRLVRHVYILMIPFFSASVGCELYPVLGVYLMSHANEPVMTRQD